MNRETIFLGSLYALQQAGFLLEDAVILSERERLVTASGLALLAREEIGRHILLQDAWREATADVSAERIKKLCEDHVIKQRAAQLSSVIRTDRGTALGQLLEVYRKSDPASEAGHRVRRQLDEIDEGQTKRTPDDRARRREARFYVDPRNEHQWSVPCEADLIVCANDVFDAINDYTSAVNRLMLARTHYDDATVADALDILGSTAPVLPAPPDPPAEVWAKVTAPRGDADGRRP